MNILDTIVEQKKREVAELDSDRVTVAALKKALTKRGDHRGFSYALRHPRRGSLALIAEVKKASPSAGIIRADFDPVPWQSMAVWMLTQMKRWGYVKGDVNYKQIAEQVFLLTDAKKRMKELDQKVPDGAYKKSHLLSI